MLDNDGEFRIYFGFENRTETKTKQYGFIFIAGKQTQMLLWSVNEQCPWIKWG